ncbi:MAG: hypothetical protein K2M95_03195 [Clostridiales bacterium]|nr:hypothetical protein [Clostridiales bacterium]
MTLIVPRFIDKSQYAYWQTYVLYAGYVGVLHFGLLDGLVLRYSKYDYEELDKARLRSQFQILLTFTSILTLLMIAVTFFAATGPYRTVFILVAVAIITKNVFTYNSYMFQITNRISKYVILVISQRLAYGIFVAMLLALRVNHFYWYCIADLFGDAVGIALGFVFNKGLYFGKALPMREAFGELKVNVLSGIILMMANWSAMLMIGSAKMMIQWRWDKLLFADVSFAFSVSNVFLVFVTAVSVVLFPSLQRIEREKLPEMYKNIRNILSPLLFFVMLFYFVGCFILNKWLPQYSDSLRYLGILLPIVVFSSKVSLLTNNYLKVYRKEKTMLVVNIISICVGLLLFTLCAYAFSRLIALLVCVVAVVMLNSILSEIFVMRILHIKIVKDFIIEGVMAVAFILCATQFGIWVGFGVYAAVFAVYAALNYKSIWALLLRLRRKVAPTAATVGATEGNSGSVPVSIEAESGEAQTAEQQEEITLTEEMRIPVSDGDGDTNADEAQTEGEGEE